MSISISTKSRELNPIDLKSLIVTANDDTSILFEEKLLLVDTDGMLLDKVIFAIEESSFVKDEFSVYMYTLGASRQFRVESQVSRDLETPSELRRIRDRNRITMLKITEKDFGWDIFKVFTNFKYGWKEMKKVQKSSIEKMILEGANILLLRKIATSKVFGYFSGWTINNEGDLCVCIFEAEEGASGEVIVQRTVRGPRGEADELTTTLSGDGRVLEHHWSGSSRYLVGETSTVEPQLAQEDMEETVGATLPQPEDEADEPAYFEKKKEFLSLMRSYHMDNTDVDDMIADFLKTLLIEKPEDVIDYADKYFSEFMDINRDSQKESNPSDFMDL